MRRRVLSIVSLLSATTSCNALLGLDEDPLLYEESSGKGGSAGAGGTGGATSGPGGSGGSLLPAASALVAFAIDDGEPMVRGWSGSAWGDAEATTAVEGGEIRWIVMDEKTPASHPMMLVEALGVDSTLSLLRLTDGGWVVDWNEINVGDTFTRPFDIAFETGSRDALCVYGDFSNTPRYRVFSNGVWSAPASLPDSANGDAVGWVELVAAPSSDEITALYSAGDDLFATTWDGETWLDPDPLEFELHQTEFLGFAGAYESIDDDFVALWGYNNATPSAVLRWARRDPSESPLFNPPIEAPYPPFTRPGVAAFAADPSSDRIALSYLEGTCGFGGCDDFTGGMWNGGSLVDGAVLDVDIGGGVTYGNRPGSMPVDVAWHDGGAIAAFGDENPLDGELHWGAWRDDGNGWGGTYEKTEMTPPLAALVNVRAIHLAAEPIFLLSDVDSALWAKQWNGTTWLDSNEGQPLAESLSSSGDGVSIAGTVIVP